MDPPVVAARDVVVERGGTVVLDGVTLEVPAERSLLVRGSSGAGKTTLFEVLGLLQPPDAGRVEIDGRAVEGMRERRRARLRRDRVGVVFQDFQLIDDLTARENARLPQTHDRSLLGLGDGGPDEDDAAWLDTVFGRLDIADLADRYPPTLSGGERQRVAIARAVANRPAVLLADEPTGQLDPETTERVLDLLLEIYRVADTALVVVSHDPQLRDRFDDTVRLLDGKIRAGTAEDSRSGHTIGRDES